MGFLWNPFHVYRGSSVYGTNAKCILEPGDGVVDKAIATHKENVSEDSRRR